MSGRHPPHQVRLPANLQTWRHLTFLHWPYAVATVQQLVPDRLRVQEWEGVTWVGITPFEMARVRPPGLPPPPGWDAFGELNVRSYVRADDGRDGIWFLTMLVPRVSFQAALGSIGLPYVRSDCRVEATGSSWDYRFGEPAQVHPPADDWFRAHVEVGAPLPEADRTQLVDSLTGRWWAFHRRARILWRTPVHHEPWPLHTATVTGDLVAPLLLAGLPVPEGPPIVHAAPVVHARLGPLRPA
ncbi:YqjF family protein [Ornithinimicrobium cavernae]|uniref:YqjF family protein n=1 Tax=Ornithinimicrobium cavernae TaxID=2666047 RepID=UPI000D68D85F|nr:DUF2071 domain-containing protein [Ornithinimicrobium cavernae]